MTPYNNTDDYVVLLNENLEILDELHYTEKMHTPFLANRKGISLERISFSVPSGTSGNWHSAAEDAGLSLIHISTELIPQMRAQI